MLDILSHKVIKTCRKCSLTGSFMLLFQFFAEQYYFSEADKWLTDNLVYLGKRAVFVILKDGSII